MARGKKKMIVSSVAHRSERLVTERGKGKARALFVGHTRGRLVQSSKQKQRRRRGFSSLSFRHVEFGAAAPVINVPAETFG